MEQLTFFDHIASLEKKAEKAVKKAAETVKKAIIKPPELVLSIDKKKGTFCSFSDLGVVKFEILRRAGVLDGVKRFDNVDVIKLVRGEKEDIFKKLDDTVIGYGFDPEAEKRLKSLRKEFRRRNIALRVDVGEEDLVV